jgi:hypothetical protein
MFQSLGVSSFGVYNIIFYPCNSGDEIELAALLTAF